MEKLCELCSGNCNSCIPHGALIVTRSAWPGVHCATDCKARAPLSTVRGSLQSGDKTIVELLGSFAHLEDVEGPVRMDATPPDLPPPDECIGRSIAPGDAPSLMSKVDLRLHLEDTLFASGKPTGRPLFRGWLRCRFSTRFITGGMLEEDG